MAVQEFTVSGEGSEDLGGYLDLYGIAWDATVVGVIAQERSNGSPKRLMHFGWIALGFEFESGPELQVEWHKYVEFEREYVSFPVLMTAHHLIWHLDPGNEVHIAAFY